MKKLTITQRQDLLSFAEKVVSCPDEEEIFEKAYEAAKPIVISAVLKVFPSKDMKVLERYGASRVDRCIRISGGTFVFKDDGSAPLVPRYSGCSDNRYQFTASDVIVLSNYMNRMSLWKDKINEKLAHYKQLILSCKTFDDVVSIWPAAEAMRVKLYPDNGSKNSLISVDLANFIKSDNAGGEK